jgi:hypothetical protein
MRTVQTAMPRVGFEPTITMFERAKTVHALDRAVTVIGKLTIYKSKNSPISPINRRKLVVPQILHTNTTFKNKFCIHRNWMENAIGLLRNIRYNISNNVSCRLLSLLAIYL